MESHDAEGTYLKLLKQHEPLMSATGAEEQWVYQHAGRRRYLHFRNRRLASMSDYGQ